MDLPAKDLPSKPSRRTLLQGAAALAATPVTGFPAVHAAEPVTLRYLGTAVNQSADIARKVKEDLGLTIEYIPVVTDEVTKRAVTQPNSFDLIDTEYFSLKKILPVRQPAGHGRQADQARRQDLVRLHQGRSGGKADRRPGHGTQEGLLPGGPGRRRSSPANRPGGSR